MFDNYFELRQLRKDVKTLERDVRIAVDYREQAERKIIKLERELKDMTSARDKLETSNTKLKKVVRDQTGADLLVNALISLGVVPKPTEDYDPFARQKNLLDQQRLAGHYTVQGSPQGQALQSLLGGAVR